MHTLSYCQRRGEITTYFDRTAREAWERLTSDAPVSGIRATVRAGRERMRETLIGWLPADLDRARVLDAGCGTGTMALALAERGADVVGIDVAPGLIEIARRRAHAFLHEKVDRLARGSVEFMAGDMLDPALGQFDYVMAMDSLIHYRLPDMIAMIERLADRTSTAMLFTFAPRTPALALMHSVGRLFPRKNRAPAIEPVEGRLLGERLVRHGALEAWRQGRSQRIAHGFYTSQAQELVRA
jgi:magnesium-protoporphyrin O-methyltransferase